MDPVLGSNPFYIVFIHMESLQQSVDISILAMRKQAQSRGAGSQQQPCLLCLPLEYMFRSPTDP